MECRARCWLLVLHCLATREEERRLERGSLSIIASIISWGSESIVFAGFDTSELIAVHAKISVNVRSCEGVQTQNSRKMGIEVRIASVGMGFFNFTRAGDVDLENYT